MSVGVLSLAEARYEQTATGILEIEVAGFSPSDDTNGPEHDVLVISDAFGEGDATLDGELRFVFDEMLSPRLGDEVRFLVAESITGEFASVTGLPELDDGLMWALAYGDTSVSVEVALAGDFNADGRVGAADYTVWRDGFAAGGYTVADYTAWRTNFGATAGAAAGASVPEPGTAWLLFGLAMGVGFTRRRQVTSFQAAC